LGVEGVQTVLKGEGVEGNLDVDEIIGEVQVFSVGDISTGGRSESILGSVTEGSDGKTGLRIISNNSGERTTGSGLNVLQFESSVSGEINEESDIDGQEFWRWEEDEEVGLSGGSIGNEDFDG